MLPFSLYFFFIVITVIYTGHRSINYFSLIYFKWFLNSGLNEKKTSVFHSISNTWLSKPYLCLLLFHNEIKNCTTKVLIVVNSPNCCKLMFLLCTS